MASKSNYVVGEDCLVTSSKGKLNTNKRMEEALEFVTEFTVPFFSGDTLGLVGKDNAFRHDIEHSRMGNNHIWAENNFAAFINIKIYARGKNHIRVVNGDIGDVLREEIRKGTKISYLDDDNIGFLDAHRLAYINTAMEYGVDCITMVMSLKWCGNFISDQHSKLNAKINETNRDAGGYFRDAQYSLIEQLCNNNGYTIIFRNSYSGGQQKKGMPMLCVTVLRGDLVKNEPVLKKFKTPKKKKKNELVGTDSKIRAGYSSHRLFKNERTALSKIMNYFESCWNGEKYIVEPTKLHQIYKNSHAYKGRPVDYMTLKRQLGLEDDRRKWREHRDGVPVLRHLDAPIKCIIDGKLHSLARVFKGY